MMAEPQIYTTHIMNSNKSNNVSEENMDGLNGRDGQAARMVDSAVDSLDVVVGSVSSGERGMRSDPANVEMGSPWAVGSVAGGGSPGEQGCDAGGLSPQESCVVSANRFGTPRPTVGCPRGVVPATSRVRDESTAESSPVPLERRRTFGRARKLSSDYESSKGESNSDGDAESGGTVRKFSARSSPPISVSSEEEREAYCLRKRKVGPKTRMFSSDISPPTKKEKKEKKVLSPPKEMRRSERLNKEPIFETPGIRSLGALAIGAQIENWVDQLEELRVKSKNIKGDISNRMKMKYKSIKEASATLALRVEESGDPMFLRMRNRELSKKVAKLEEENAALKRSLAIRDIGGPVDQPPENVVVEPDVETIALARRWDERKPMVEIPMQNINEFKGKESQFGFNVTGEMEISSGEELEGVLLQFLDNRRKRKYQRTERQRILLDDNNRMSGTQRETSGKKKLPRIIENVMLVPPREGGEAGVSSGRSGDERGWSEVTRHGRRRDRGVTTNVGSNAGGMLPHAGSIEKFRVGGEKVKDRTPRPPKFAAVSLTCVGNETSYASVLREARDKVALEDLDIHESRIRRAMNGGLLIEIPGPEGAKKADVLARKLSEVLVSQVKIGRPIRKGELRIFGLDDSVREEEVACVLATLGGCLEEEVKVGEIRYMSNGLRMVWVQCPLEVAIKATSGGRIKIGWSSARIELLKGRPVQCFKCWSYGHLRSTCKSSVDRTGACFNCGQWGHLSKGCTNPTCCVLCKDIGKDSDHRLGGERCECKHSTQQTGGRSMGTMRPRRG